MRAHACLACILTEEFRILARTHAHHIVRDPNLFGDFASLHGRFVRSLQARPGQVDVLEILQFTRLLLRVLATENN